MKDDPRITRVGAFIRRYSLDELPQLFNVLNGTMSLIGPRPPLPREVAAYEGRVNRRLLIKPGITGLWQVSGRSNLSWEESVKLDLYYVENWSVTTDFMILLKTVKAVVAQGRRLLIDPLGRVGSARRRSSAPGARGRSAAPRSGTTTQATPSASSAEHRARPRARRSASSSSGGTTPDASAQQHHAVPHGHRIPRVRRRERGERPARRRSNPVGGSSSFR